MFGEADLFKKDLSEEGVDILQLPAEEINIFQEMGEFKVNNLNLKESITIISNYIDCHLQEEEGIYEFDDERFVDNEEKRAIEAERKLKDTFAHTQLRKYLPGNIKCLDSLKSVQLRKVTLIALEQVHFVFESLLMLKPFIKPVMNN